jgi:hypothetical protein
VDTAAARALVARFLADHPDGGWPTAAQVADLLACYRIPIPAAGASSSSDAGVELVVQALQQPIFGPLVVLGLGGSAIDVLAERSARLAPLTDADAESMVGAVRAAPMLLGRAGSAAVAALLLRVSRLADDLPEVAGLDLSPVMAGPERAHPAAARLRIVPMEPTDPFLRQLRPRSDGPDRAPTSPFRGRMTRAPRSDTRKPEDGTNTW